MSKKEIISSITGIKYVPSNTGLARRLSKKAYRLLPQLPEDDKRYIDIKALSEEESPTIVDGGAHKGETIEDFKRVFDQPRIHAFEPHPKTFKELAEKYTSDDDIEVYNCALGNENGTKVFNITKSSDVASLLEPTEDYKSLLEGSIVEDKVEVEVRTLDEVVDEKVDILKLDLQGGEYHALEGAQKLLKNVRIVTSEVMFNENYKGQKVFSDMDDIMSKNGFELQNIYNIRHWPDNQARHGDVVYLHE